VRASHEATLTVPSPTLICAVLALTQPAALSAQSVWLLEPAVQQRLAVGEVVVETGDAIDPAAPRGRVRAAVRIPAPAEAVWSVMTDCAEAPHYVPGLKHCRRIDGAPDGRWEDIEHEVRYSWLLPSVRYVFRAQYERPHRVDFHRISGDLKEESGTWLLTETRDGTATVVEYDVYLDPGFWIPQFLVARMLRKDVPEVLSGLRERVAEDGRRGK
jgi:coenzyme Q-binding protein COQ10